MAVISIYFEICYSRESGLSFPDNVAYTSQVLVSNTDILKLRSGDTIYESK
jgi:hypothetical protein